MKYPLLFGCLLALLLAGGCGEGAGSSGAPSAGSSPETPEEVVRQYQASLDANQFEEARALSTPEEQARLDELERIFAREMQDSSILHTRFLSMDCRVLGDTARCYSEVADEYEEYAIEYMLVRQRGRWLIAAPEEDYPIDHPVYE